MSRRVMHRDTRHAPLQGPTAAGCRHPRTALCLVRRAHLHMHHRTAEVLLLLQSMGTDWLQQSWGRARRCHVGMVAVGEVEQECDCDVM
jgi:hypothetical protein